MKIARLFIFGSLIIAVCATGAVYSIKAMKKSADFERSKRHYVGQLIRMGWKWDGSTLTDKNGQRWRLEKTDKGLQPTPVR